MHGQDRRLSTNSQGALNDKLSKSDNRSGGTGVHL